MSHDALDDVLPSLEVSYQPLIIQVATIHKMIAILQIGKDKEMW